MELISGGSRISERERLPLILSENLLFGKVFVENFIKNERNWTERGEVRIPCDPLDPTMQIAASLWPGRDVFH